MTTPLPNEKGAFVSFLSKNDQNTKTILFMHGNSLNKECFANQLDDNTLSKYRLVAFDISGHGESSKIDNYSILRLKTIILEFIKIQNLDNFIIVGHSLGGHLGIQTLPAISDKCKGIFVFGTPPLKESLNINEAFLPNENIPFLLQRNLQPNEIDSLSKAIYNSEDENFQKIKKSISNTDGKFREDFGSSLNAGDLQDEVKILSNYSGYTTILHGNDDVFVNIEYLSNLKKEELPNADLITIDNSGHCPHIDASDLFNSHVLNFANKTLKSV
ncbi:alpha/beta hydrolase [uncultured Aquimarina sp.]|uniref:alpha/beta fold hydrolase n=1 Tax=uncultured Aquimarina sp. TaxID=575652 RepID=UPI00260CE193|nr:alpha/beta hydrolase [uncultured Aquimarina sp.]